MDVDFRKNIRPEDLNSINALAHADGGKHLFLLLKAQYAMDKQVAEKPMFEGDGYSDGELVSDTWICPCCEKRFEVEYEEYKYCPECGQRIDWGKQVTRPTHKVEDMEDLNE